MSRRGSEELLHVPQHKITEHSTLSFSSCLKTFVEQGGK